MVIMIVGNKGGFMIKNDFEMIVWKLEEDLDFINIYPIGDLHIGSPQFDQKVFDSWIKMVQNDPKGYVVIIGDMTDNGLKDSKTDAFKAGMSPFEQKEYLVTSLEKIKDKILGAVQGNHELRSKYVSDLCPLYEAMAKLDLEHLYRENATFIKISLGKKNADRQWTYTLVLQHGKSRGKRDNFSYAIDGMDVFVTGHTHGCGSEPRAKIVIDSKNDKVTMRNFYNVTVPSFLNYGGYAMRDMYMPVANDVFPIIQLDGARKHIVSYQV